MDDDVSLVERQIDALRGLDDPAEFLVSVGPAIQAISSAPRIAVHLDDLRAETFAHIGAIQEIDVDLVREIQDLRQRFVSLWPALDDSDREQPEFGRDGLSWEGSLAAFDLLASSTPAPFNAQADQARAPRLLEILQSKKRDADEHDAADDADVRPEGAEAWIVDLHNLQERWEHARRGLSLVMRASAGLALLEFERVPRALNPEPVVREVGEDLRTRLQVRLLNLWSTDQLLYDTVHNPPQVSTSEHERLLVHMSTLRAGLTRLEVEVVRRLGTIRSLRALVSRFKIRAEWHDAARLAAIAADDEAPGGPEDRLTAELATYLFDAGLNPLTKPMTGGLEPDLLDASLRPAFYVEAKQYKANGRREVVGGVRQVLDTVGRLQGGAYGVSEAFCVIFRRGGPRYIVPEVIDAEGYRLYLVLVDIAPTAVSGRRQRRKPSVIELNELLEQK